MPKSSPEQFLESKAEETLQVVGQDGQTRDQKEMMKQAKVGMGEGLLESTLALTESQIEKQLRKKTNERLAKQLLAELRQDGNRLTAIKQELLENIGKNQGDDKRADVAGRIANELIAQTV